MNDTLLRKSSVSLLPPADRTPWRTPADGRVIVVSPHPDDDIIGSGGTMALLARAGFAVFSAYITDGRSAGDSADTAAEVRKSEAVNALKVVKARGGFFLCHASGELTGTSAGRVVDEVAFLFQSVGPEEIYLPSPFEGHPTHVRTTKLSVKALQKTRGLRPRLWGYGVWGCLTGLCRTRTVDITTVIAAKKRALRCHAGQLSGKPYDEGIAGRNRYEGVFMNTHDPVFCRYAETFLDMGELVENRRLSLESFVRKIAAEGLLR